MSQLTQLMEALGANRRCVLLKWEVRCKENAENTHLVGNRHSVGSNRQIQVSVMQKTGTVYLVPAHISSVLSALTFSRLADIHWLIAEMHCSSSFTDDNTLLRSQSNNLASNRFKPPQIIFYDRRKRSFHTSSLFPPSTVFIIRLKF